MAGAVVVALAAAGWLFLAPGGEDDPAPKAEPGTTEERDQGESFLTVPEDGDGTPDAARERRDGSGTGRLDPDEAVPGETDTTNPDEDRPVIEANLRGVRIALQPATSSIDDPALATKRTNVGGLRLRCAPGQPAADASARLRSERDLVAALAADLRAAKAAPVMAGEDAADDCAAARARRFGASDLALVVAVDPDATRARVLSGRPAAKASASAALAAEDAAAVDAPATVEAKSRADQALLAELGAVALPDGAQVTYVVFPPTSEGDTVDDRVRALVGALATTASRIG